MSDFPRDASKSSGYSSNCAECKRKYGRARYAANPEPVKAKQAAYIEKNYELLRQKRQALRKTPEGRAAKAAADKRRRLEKRLAVAAISGKYDAHIMQWKYRQPAKPELHNAHVRALKADKAAWFRIRYQNDAEFNLKQRVRAQVKKSGEKYRNLAEMMRYSIKRRRTSQTLRRVIGVTAEQLRAHLERQFTKGMNWDRFLAGEIHIDHIVPRTAFNLHCEDDIAACWSLPNLRPMWARDNLEKRDKRVSLL